MIKEEIVKIILVCGAGLIGIKLVHYFAPTITEAVCTIAEKTIVNSPITDSVKEDITWSIFLLSTLAIIAGCTDMISNIVANSALIENSAIIIGLTPLEQLNWIQDQEMLLSSQIVTNALIEKNTIILSLTPLQQATWLQDYTMLLNSGVVTQALNSSEFVKKLEFCCLLHQNYVINLDSLSLGKMAWIQDQKFLFNEKIVTIALDSHKLVSKLEYCLMYKCYLNTIFFESEYSIIFEQFKNYLKVSGKIEKDYWEKCLPALRQCYYNFILNGKIDLDKISEFNLLNNKDFLLVLFSICKQQGLNVGILHEFNPTILHNVITGNLYELSNDDRVANIRDYIYCRAEAVNRFSCNSKFFLKHGNLFDINLNSHFYSGILDGSMTKNVYMTKPIIVDVNNIDLDYINLNPEHSYIYDILKDMHDKKIKAPLKLIEMLIDTFLK